jgi:hypothetical protein
MELKSFDGPSATGNEVDRAAVQGVIAEGDAGSAGRPFKVDPEGSVDFLFNTGVVFENNNWSIYAQGIPVAILSGSDDNPGDIDETGVVNIGDSLKLLPFKVVGTFYVTGDLWGNQNTRHCRGEGYVQLLGDPIGTPLWIIAAALLALGGAGMLLVTPYSRDWEVDQLGGERLHTGPITDEGPNS